MTGEEFANTILHNHMRTGYSVVCSEYKGNFRILNMFNKGSAKETEQLWD